MNQERGHDGNGVGVLGQRNWNGVDENRDQNTASSTGHDHEDKLVGEGSFVANGIEDLASCCIMTAQGEKILVLARRYRASST